jgi:dolichyl-phosphate-mannose--protein O-mannosyl transferase
LVALDGMLIVQSRTAILDSLLPPLVVGAALLLVVHLDKHPAGRLTGWTVGAGALLGAALAVKWQAGTVLLGVVAAFGSVSRRDRRSLAALAVAFVLVPAAVYVASYAGHFADGLTPGAWVRMQRDMVDYHRQFRVDHPRDSSPFTWLWLQRPVSYGSLHSPGRIAITMAFGNPALWWGFLASLPILLVTWWRGRDRTVELVLLAWVTLHLSWLVVFRPGFIYYLTPLVPFMAVGVTWVARSAVRRSRWGALVPAVVGIGAAVAFVAFLPVWTYQDISVEHFDRLMLFPGWEL